MPLALLALAACAAPITPMPTPTLDVRPITIVTLGDSLTEGDKDDSSDGGGWPRRIRSVISAQRPGSQVINFARAGWTSTDLLYGANGEPNQIDRAVDTLRRAAGVKIATVWIGANDLFYLYEFGDPTPDEERVDRDRFIANLDETLRRLSETGVKIFVAQIGDPVTWGAPQGGLFFSTTPDEWSRLSKQAAAYDAALQLLAAKHTATLVDVHATHVFTTPSLMDPDGIHPNARGYDALAGLWLKMLTR
ncbi:MAG: SGNH/GDSL hydrolase family protein [Chloroflexi bacterium]|nr:SGNH/GDSL hydrolase family protein [Chloroflexota bacterium]